MKAFALLAVVCLIGVDAGASGAAVRTAGTLTGTTQISFGCPGPVSSSGPTCHPWHAFPNARFSIARRSVDGMPVPMTAIDVTSNAQGTFHVRLGAGTYLVTPLPQRSTHGGPRLTVRIRAGATTRVLVRFVGFPQMA
jgi:hypothetical protein